jgi:hypothetical protein
MAVTDGTGATAAETVFAAGGGGALRRGACATKGAQLQIPLNATIAAKLTNRAVIRAVVRTREGYSIGNSRATLKNKYSTTLRTRGSMYEYRRSDEFTKYWRLRIDEARRVGGAAV